MTTIHFNYQEYLALILIYTANASDGISPSESDYILSEVGTAHYEKAMDFFDQSSEVEIIDKIQELSAHYAQQDKEQVFNDLQALITVDEVDQEVEEQILRMLKKLI